MEKRIKFDNKAEVLLAMIILARSTSFIMTKMVIQSMGIFNLLSLRFMLAFVILLPFGWNKLKLISKDTILHGMVLGLAFVSVMTAEITALKTTDVSTVALLENTAIVFVPLIEAIIQHRGIKKHVVFSVLLTFTGVVLITFEGAGLNLSLGEGLGLIAALLYGVAIILTARFSRKEDPLALGIVQVGFMGVFSTLSAFAFETPRFPQSVFEMQIIIALAIVCSVFGFTLQPLAQSKTSAERAGMFCALSPASAVVLSFIFLGEELSLLRMMGILIILAGLMSSHMLERIRVTKLKRVNAFR